MIKDINLVNNKLYAISKDGKLYLYNKNEFNVIYNNNDIELRQILSFENKPLLCYATSR